MSRSSLPVRVKRPPRVRRICRRAWGGHRLRAAIRGVREEVCTLVEGCQLMEDDCLHRCFCQTPLSLSSWLFATLGVLSPGACCSAHIVGSRPSFLARRTSALFVARRACAPCASEQPASRFRLGELRALSRRHGDDRLELGIARRTHRRSGSGPVGIACRVFCGGVHGLVVDGQCWALQPPREGGRYGKEIGCASTCPDEIFSIAAKNVVERYAPIRSHLQTGRGTLPFPQVTFTAIIRKRCTIDLPLIGIITTGLSGGTGGDSATEQVLCVATAPNEVQNNNASKPIVI